MEQCNHADISGCDMECDCACTICLNSYIEKWDKMVVELNLCSACGVPNALTPDTLIQHQHVHFFDPCDDCIERFQICMAIAQLCEVCHSHIDACKCDHSA